MTTEGRTPATPARTAASAQAASAGPARAPEPGRELTMTRLFRAPREFVFAAWTEAEHFARWFGPKEFLITGCAIDARPGGEIRFCMGPEGEGYWHAGEFREVVAPERLVFTLRFVDESGRPVPHPHFPGWPVAAEFVQTVTFAERDGATEVTLHQIITPPEAAAHPVFDIERPMAKRGWLESFERLDALLEGRVDFATLRSTHG